MVGAGGPAAAPRLPVDATPVPILRIVARAGLPVLGGGSAIALAEYAGASQLAWATLVFGLGLLVALAAIVVGLPLAWFRPRVGAAVFLAGVAAAAAIVVVLQPVRWAREAAFRRAADAAEPLLAAIDRYRQVHGRAPERLSELVPEQLPAVPGTGMYAYPEFRDELRPPGLPAGVAYELCIECGIGPLNWDVFVYWPVPTYPERMYGGVVKRLGSWAYVVE